MSMESFAVKVDGATIAGEYRRGVDHTPLVLIHGFGGSRDDWAHIVAELPREWPLVIYDQRGFGASAGGADAPFSHADDLLAVLEALKLDEADLCGFSMGGATALGAALHEPERIGRIALLSPMLAGWSWSAPWVERWKAVGRLARAGDMESARELWWSHPLFAKARDAGHGEELRRTIGAFSGAQWIRDDQRQEYPMVERLHRVSQPTLLLTGHHDLPDFQLMADLIAAAVPDVRRIDDPDAGHMLPLEKPRHVAAELTRFLDASP